MAFDPSTALQAFHPTSSRQDDAHLRGEGGSSYGRTHTGKDVGLPLRYLLYRKQYSEAVSKPGPSVPKLPECERSSAYAALRFRDPQKQCIGLSLHSCSVAEGNNSDHCVFCPTHSRASAVPSAMQELFARHSCSIHRRVNSLESSSSIRTSPATQRRKALVITLQRPRPSSSGDRRRDGCVCNFDNWKVLK